MLLTAVLLLALLAVLIAGLRHPVYLLNVALVLVGAWSLDRQLAFTPQLDAETLLRVALLHLLSINVTVFVAYGWDKSAARAGWRRIPERTLHALAIAGGTPGAWIASKVFHHKSIKQSFRKTFTLILTLQLIATAATLLWLWWQQGGSQ